MKKNPRLLKSFQSATVDITVAERMCWERYDEVKSMGRIVLRDRGQTVCVGIVVA